MHFSEIFLAIVSLFVYVRSMVIISKLLTHLNVKNIFFLAFMAFIFFGSISSLIKLNIKSNCFLFKRQYSLNYFISIFEWFLISIE